MSYLIFFLLNLSNFWIWEIFKFNLVITIIIILASFLLLKNSEESESKHKKIYSFSFFLVFSILIYFQVTTSKITNLVEIRNDDRRLIDMRLKEYPPIYVTFGKKTLWLPLAYWFEARKETIIFSRILNNFSEVIDPNLYFFANHPRERVGFREILKFPYILIPFFLYGMFLITKEKQKLFWLISLIIPISTLSVMGSNNPAGPFIFYPYLSSVIVFGIKKYSYRLSFKNKIIKSLFLIIFLVLYFLVIFQEIYTKS